MNQLPNGVTRNAQARDDVTLENCNALLFEIAPLHYVIAWRGHPGILRSEDKTKRLRDLRPGDWIEVDGERQKIIGIEIYR